MQIRSVPQLLRRESAVVESAKDLLGKAVCGSLAGEKMKICS
jgi:hypothetical protein